MLIITHVAFQVFSWKSVLLYFVCWNSTMMNYVVSRRPKKLLARCLFHCRSHSNLEVVSSSLLLNTCFLEFFLLKFTEYLLLSIKYVVLSRPKIMIRQICSISAYILKFVTSTFLFIGANGIFQILSLAMYFWDPYYIF